MKRYDGYYADADGIHPWTESPVDGGLDRYQGEVSMRSIRARHAPETITFDVTPTVRRTPQERLADVTERITQEALKSYETFGKVVFPRSVLEGIQQEFWAAGEPISLAQIESLAEGEIRPLCERYAQIMLQKSHRQYKDNAVMAPEIKGVS